MFIKFEKLGTVFELYLLFRVSWSRVVDQS